MNGQMDGSGEEVGEDQDRRRGVKKCKNWKKKRKTK